MPKHGIWSRHSEFTICREIQRVVETTTYPAEITCPTCLAILCEELHAKVSKVLGTHWYSDAVVQELAKER